MLGRLFSTRRVGDDGTLHFEDYGECGTFQGDVDEDGNRRGEGKMTYARGNVYEGPFLNDKFHGERGVYRWSDGDEYVGPWRDGERHGGGIFRSADGAVMYAAFDGGEVVGPLMGIGRARWRCRWAWRRSSRGRSSICQCRR